VARNRFSNVTKQLSSLGSCRATAAWTNPRVFKGTGEKSLGDGGMDLTGKEEGRFAVWLIAYPI